MEFHPAANIFPLDDEHIDELAEDIKANGQLIPVEILDGKILDGRRRWCACQQAGIEAELVEVDVDDPVAYVMSLNLHRRHLTKSQAAMCADRARAMYEQAAKERQIVAGKEHGRGKVVEIFTQPIDAGKARDQVGEAFGVSGVSVDKAARVRRNGIPGLVKAVEDGKVTVSKASEICTNPKELQEDLLEAALTAKTPQHKAKPGKPEKNTPEGESRGVGIIRANEAVNALSRIPKNDALRKRGFQLVSDWIKANR